MSLSSPARWAARERRHTNNDVSELRDRDDLSQGDLAAAVGVSRQTINAIEREWYDPSLELAFKLVQCFDCTVEEIFDPELENT